ncbi:MAG: hypothetical protein LBF83_01560 [Spirochaetaceae bacterium]|jgi:predicted transposase/invertase (TIGR01784 family)|nr:hypothetical protein [Spirochaetaceae bacterium]
MRLVYRNEPCKYCNAYKDVPPQSGGTVHYFRYLPDKGSRNKINEILNYEEGIAMASEVLVNISRDEIERARLLSEYKYIVDTQSKVVQAERNGWKQGQKQGRKQEKLEIAGNLKNSGIPAPQIALWTGLSIEDIAKL